MKQGNMLPHLRAPDNETIVVCALPSEIPEALPEVVLFTGVGKINASYSLTRYLSNHPEIKKIFEALPGLNIHSITDITDTVDETTNEIENEKHKEV